jgi:hypothetical protein
MVVTARSVVQLMINASPRIKFSVLLLINKPILYNNIMFMIVDDLTSDTNMIIILRVVYLEVENLSHPLLFHC